MKKIIALALVIMTLVTVSCTACAKTAYDPDKAHFVVVAWDPDDTINAPMYTTVVTYKTLVRLAKNHCLQEAYELESDGLAPLEWTVTEEGEVIFTWKYTGEVMEEE